METVKIDPIKEEREKNKREAETVKSFERRFLRRSYDDKINAIKDHLMSKMSDTVFDGNDFKHVLGDSNFQRVADYFNAPSEIEVPKKLSPQEVSACIDFDEFAKMDVQKQNTWLAMVLGGISISKEQLGSLFDKKTMAAIDLKSVKKLTIFESLFKNNAMSGYIVTAHDIEESLR